MSYSAYRRTALIMKSFPALGAIFLFSFLNSSCYASVLLENYGSVWRLKGPLRPTPFKVLESKTDTQGSACQGAATTDLVLLFNEEPAGWLEGLSSLKDKGPCAVGARPLTESPEYPGARYEIRLSYNRGDKKSAAAKEPLQMLSFQIGQNFYVDHWFGVEKKKVLRTARKKVVIKDSALKQENNVPVLSGATLQELFEDKSSWERLLGSSAMAHDFNSPELDRFRIPKNTGALENPYSASLAQQPLQLPALDLPLMNEGLDFLEETYEFVEFPEFYVGEGGEKLPPRMNKGLHEGLNFILLLAKRGEWIKAQKAIVVLEGSEFGKKLGAAGARYSALKGLVHLKLGLELKEKMLFNEGLDIWRDALKSSASGRGGVAQEYVEFMALESVRRLFDDGKPYAALALLSWAQRLAWSARAEERFAFLRGEAYFRLGIWEEAKKNFEEYFSSRSSIPLSAWVDRRLVPAAAFRLGDIYFQMKKFAEANKEYTKAMNQMPISGKFSFEGNWYPETVKQFPEVLYNRAETSTRLGYYENALKDLRAFLFTSPNHPDVALILYRIGDLIARLSPVAEQEKVAATWRECIFRVPETMGARLCAARKAATDIVNFDKKEWSRLIATIEEALPIKKESFWKNFGRDDLEVYVALILGDAFIRAGAPTQALFRLDAALKFSPSLFLRSWLEEYVLTAFAGTLQLKLKEGKFKEIIADYDLRRRQILYKQTRPEILWNVVLAYKALGLYTQAFETLLNAEKVRDAIARKIPRPYDPSREDWLYARVEIEMELLAQRKIQAEVVKTTLQQLDAKKPGTLRLSIRLAQMLGDNGWEVKTWQELEKGDALSWEDVRRYADALKKQPTLVGQRTRLLEERIGTWLAEKERLGSDKSPPADLIFDLAEIRSESRKPESALTAYDFLLQIDKNELGKNISPALISFKQGDLLRKLNRLPEARQSFARAKASAPDSVWGKLAAAADRELNLPKP